MAQTISYKLYQATVVHFDDNGTTWTTVAIVKATSDANCIAILEANGFNEDDTSITVEEVEFTKGLFIVSVDGEQ